MKYLLSWVEIEDANENAINTSWKYKLVNTRSISVKDRNKIYSKRTQNGITRFLTNGKFWRIRENEFRLVI